MRPKTITNGRGKVLGVRSPSGSPSAWAKRRELYWESAGPIGVRPVDLAMDFPDLSARDRRRGIRRIYFADWERALALPPEEQVSHQAVGLERWILWREQAMLSRRGIMAFERAYAAAFPLREL